MKTVISHLRIGTSIDIQSNNNFYYIGIKYYVTLQKPVLKIGEFKLKQLLLGFYEYF